MPNPDAQQVSARPRPPKRPIGIYLRGLAMGAADLVPGVSGGTVALITGIYEDLVGALSRIGPGLLWAWRHQGFVACWKQANAGFLLVLGLGILTSVVSLSRVIVWALEQHPIPVWSFFFGLIAASGLLLGGRVGRWSQGAFWSAVAGALAGYLLTSLEPSAASPSLLFVLSGGAAAITAMILPGISGSFILLVLGLYHEVLRALHEWDLGFLATFSAGCILGLMLFSRVLNWLLHHRRNATLAALTGVLLGSLHQVWPWRQVVSYRIDSSGEMVPLVEHGLAPNNYAELLDADPMLGTAVLCMGLGIALVLVPEWWARRR
ncbi:MAG: DUF368 domain-containing protein [Pseudomonadota bacterium]|nr:DUF368 domain-containing protein [Pseudomonadota bacterium]